ncbi:PFE-CTERM domain-containing protein [Trichormus variabilis]|uniref:PFE-CTERM domain-containing protein n=1 Tax=Anabaena variabilis TaxID=264691 RepID=UPI0035A26094
MAGETVTSVIVTIAANLASSGTVTNNNATTSTFRVTSLADQYDFNPLAGAPAALTAFGTFSPILSGTAIGTQQLFSSVPVGGTRNFSLQTVSGSASQTFTDVADIAGFLGSGSYSYAPITSIGRVISGGGGNIAANIATFAGGTLTVEYQGTSVPVPFDFNPAIGIVTLGIYFGTSKLYKRYLINKSGKN